MRKKKRKKSIKGIPFFYGYSFNGFSKCKNCDIDRTTLVVPHPVEDQNVSCEVCGNPVLGNTVSESKKMKILKEYNPMKAVFHFTPQNSKEITVYSDVSIENAISTLENVRKYIKIPEMEKMIKCLKEIQAYGDAYGSMSFLQMQTLKEAIRSFLDEVYSSGNYFPGKSELEEVHTMIEVMMELAVNQDMEKIDRLKKEIGSGKSLPMAAEGLQRQIKESVNFSDPEDINGVQHAIGAPMSDFIRDLRDVNNEITREIDERIVSGDIFSKEDFLRYYEILQNQLDSSKFMDIDDPESKSQVGKEYHEKLSSVVQMLQELVMLSSDDEMPDEVENPAEETDDIEKMMSEMLETEVSKDLQMENTVKLKENLLKKMIVEFAKQSLKETPEDVLQGQGLEEDPPMSMEIPEDEIIQEPTGAVTSLQTAIDSLYSCYSGLSTEDMMTINNAIESLEQIKEKLKTEM